MKIAVAQLNYTPGDIRGNTLMITAAVERGKKEGVRLLLFSELSITGHYPHDLLHRKEFLTAAREAVEEIAAHCQGITALVGAPLSGEADQKPFNTAFFLANGKISDLFCKTVISSDHLFTECRHFTPGTNTRLLETGGVKIAVTISEDLTGSFSSGIEVNNETRHHPSPVDELLRLNPQLIINLSADPFSTGREEERKRIFSQKARHYGLPLIFVNQTGAQGEVIYDGGSLFFDSEGEIIREMKYFSEDFQIIDTETRERSELRPPAGKAERWEQALELGISDYFRKTGFKKAALGLSGGIDSAVVAVLAARALGPENVRAVLMPSQYSPPHSIDDAVNLARNLGISYDILPIEEPFTSILKQLDPLFGKTAPDVTEENIQARIRGVLIMALSNKLGYLVLNTSNKSEYAVGYGTLYGDMNGGLAVLGDLYKTEVYELARWINRREEIIPNNTMVKPPSAELRPGQKDSDSLPEYPLLDNILFRYLELNQPPEEIIAAVNDPFTVDRVIRLVNLNEFKRFQAAPILRISPKAFGLERQMPLTGRSGK